MADDGDGENGGALLSDPVDVVIDKLLRYGLSFAFFCLRMRYLSMQNSLFFGIFLS